MKTYYDPSTPGARYLFQLKEYLRLSGDTKQARTRFTELIKSISKTKTEDLKVKLAETKVKRLNSPSLHESKLLSADIITIEGESGRRGPVKKARSRRIVIEDEFKKLAWKTIAKELGEEKSRYILESLKTQIKFNVCPNESEEEITSIINDMLDYLFHSE